MLELEGFVLKEKSESDWLAYVPVPGSKARQKSCAKGFRLNSSTNEFEDFNYEGSFQDILLGPGMTIILMTRP